MEENTLQELNEIFRSFFKNESLNISASSSANTIPEWDSLNHMNLMSEIEQHFNIQFEFFELMDFEHVGDLVKSIIQKKQ